MSRIDGNLNWQYLQMSIYSQSDLVNEDPGTNLQTSFCFQCVYFLILITCPVLDPLCFSMQDRPIIAGRRGCQGLVHGFLKPLKLPTSVLLPRALSSNGSKYQNALMGGCQSGGVEVPRQTVSGMQTPIVNTHTLDPLWWELSSIKDLDDIWSIVCGCIRAWNYDELISSW